MSLLIKNGLVIDPANKIKDILDILIEKNKISKVDKNIKSKAQTIIDARNKIVMPGTIDMHVHLREPGREDKETIFTGTKAALKGGVTSVLAMPNTEPAMDCVNNVKLLKNIIRKDAQCNVLMSAAITKGRLGKELTDFTKLKKEGVLAISDDGASVDDAKIMLEAFYRAKKENLLVLCHCEDKSLSNKGVVNLGFTSTRLGLKGISRESEYKRVGRDIELAAKAKCTVHITHVSVKESVDLIRMAKKKNIKISADTCAHYFSLTEEAVLNYDTNTKINPPLRSAEDVQAIKEGLRDGTIDAIASDHAPHTQNEKDIEFDRAEFGKIGLESGLSISIMELIDKKILDWETLVEKISLNPAKILGIKKGTLGVGQDADIIIVDRDKEFILKKENIVSKSKNSPFIDKKLKGLVECTIFNGEIAYKI
ncbi:MAG: dihydroorotase [Candidatus Omnitrophota bacterium]